MRKIIAKIVFVALLIASAGLPSDCAAGGKRQHQCEEPSFSACGKFMRRLMSRLSCT